MPWLDWQASDVAEQLPGIRAWRAHAALPNLPAPLALDVRAGWPELPADAVFTANTLHIMGLDGVEAFFRGAGRLLHARPGAPVAPRRAAAAAGAPAARSPGTPRGRGPVRGTQPEQQRRRAELAAFAGGSVGAPPRCVRAGAEGVNVSGELAAKASDTGVTPL